MPFLYQTFYNFRNIKNDTIDISAREVYFVGENGQGKSNILESLYYAAYGNSFRTYTDSQIVKNGEKDFSINSLFNNEKEGTQKIAIIYENNKKRIEKNGKKVQDRKEIINTIPCILFCHDDMRFATGEPECRRFFVDQSLTLFDSIFIDDLRNYKKVLKSRNTILKITNTKCSMFTILSWRSSGLQFRTNVKKQSSSSIRFLEKSLKKLPGLEA